jgi:Uncharacterized protein conserved in bacteria
MKYEDLKNLNELRKSGAISEEEYQREKDRMLNRSYPPSTENLYWGMKESSYIALMHVAQFGGYIVPLLGFILPVFMWINFKDQNANINRHGQNIVNFVISWILYFIIGVILCLALVGIPILIALSATQILFTIMATIKAANDEYWQYPMSITFLR